jgi:hypothetical protein
MPGLTPQLLAALPQLHTPDMAGNLFAGQNSR